MTEQAEQLSGRALELEVAKRLFGFRWYHCIAPTGVERNQFMPPEKALVWRVLNCQADEADGPRASETNDDTLAPKFAESPEAAFQVVDKMREKGFQFQLTDRYAVDGRPWWAEFATPDNDSGGQHFAATREVAICVAALEALRQHAEKEVALAALDSQSGESKQ